MAYRRLPTPGSVRGVSPIYSEHTYGTGLGAAPSGYGELYDELFANNPYRNLHYNKTPMQRLWSWLGFRTDYDRFLEEAEMNAAQTDFGIFQQMYQDEYNSETAKAARMRAAGENPDLLGTGNVSEASSPVEDPQGMSPGISQEGVPGQIASAVIGAFNTAVGIATQFMQLDGLRADVEGKNISNAEQMMNVIKQRVLGMTPAEGFKTDQDFSDWKRRTEAVLRTNYGRAFFKGSALRQWNRSIDDFVGGLPTSKEQYSDWKQRLGDAKDYLRGREDHWSELIDVFKVVNSELIDMQKEITENSKVKEKTQLDVDIETATNELQYQEDLLPGERARAENERNRRSAEGETFEGILNKHLSKLGQRLDDLSKQGGLKGLIGEVILLIMTMRGGFSVDKKGNVSGSIQGPQAY